MVENKSSPPQLRSLDEVAELIGNNNAVLDLVSPNGAVSMTLMESSMNNQVDPLKFRVVQLDLRSITQSSKTKLFC